MNRASQLVAGGTLFVTVSLLATACAPPVPALSGAGTAPSRRAELSVGGAARIPHGDLGELDTHPILHDAQAGGMAPLMAFRYGLSDRVDLGATVVGTSLHGSIRYALRLRDGIPKMTLMAGLAPFAGPVTRADSAWRFGADAPIVLGVDFSSLVELWIGPRLRLEHTTGSFGESATAQDGHATGLSIGGVVGLAIGFRHLHVLLELTTAFESWTGELAATPLKAQGIALTPAFALRLRL